MASALGPLEASSDGSFRWHMRTSSIRETTETLSGLWSGVAQAADSDRLADDHDSQPPVRTRTSVLTLIVVAPRPETVDHAMSTVNTLAARHPSRSVILSPSDPDGPASFDAHVYASCQAPEQGVTEICTEEILIKIGGELAQHLSSTVAPLLIHDLPAVLWWPDDVPFGRADFLDLSAECDSLFVDSGHFRGDGPQRMAGMARAEDHGIVIHDVSWMRLMPWRELLASCFDHPLLSKELKALTRIRIDLARPGRSVQLARSTLFVGWLMAMLKMWVVQPLTEGEDGRWTATVRSGRREIEVEIRPVRAEYSCAARSAGSIVRAELESMSSDVRTQVTVTRQANHLLATADWNGAPVNRRASQLERFDEVPYLAMSLLNTGHDRIFSSALQKAVALAGPEATA